LGRGATKKRASGEKVKEQPLESGEGEKVFLRKANKGGRGSPPSRKRLSKALSTSKRKEAVEKVRDLEAAATRNHSGERRGSGWKRKAEGTEAPQRSTTSGTPHRKTERKGRLFLGGMG